MDSSDLLEYVTCPACDRSDGTVWLDDGKPTRYVCCSGCGTVYASPRASRKSRYAWLESTFALQPEVFTLTDMRRFALEYEADIIRPYLQGGRLLDIGCSLGAFFEFFPSPAWERYGVELSPSASEYAAQKYDSTVFTGDFCSAKFSTSFFDLVSIIDTIYYMDNPLETLHEAVRVLKPGGLLAIELFGHRYMWFRSRGLLSLILDRRWTRLDTSSSYLFFFSPFGLARLVEKCGFSPLAWYVIPSPDQAHPVKNLFVRYYFRLMKSAVSHSLRWLSFAPKYLLIACKPGD